MNNTNVLNSLAFAMSSALIKDFDDIEYEYYTDFKTKTKGKRKRRPYEHDIETIHFQQMWGSTALGFNGVGGCAMTNAYTTIVILKNKRIACVYFDGRFAYRCKVDTNFNNQCKKLYMLDVETAKKEFEII